MSLASDTACKRNEFPDGGQKTPDVHCVAQGNIDLSVKAGDGPVHNMWVDSIFNLFHLSWEHSF